MAITLEEAMEEIKSGLTGNDEIDRDYLVAQKVKYLSTPISAAVTREITRMLYDRLPKDGDIEIIGIVED